MLMSRKPRPPDSQHDDPPTDKRAEAESLDPRDWDELGDWLNHDWRELRANGRRYVGAYFDLFQLKSSRLAAYAAFAGFAAIVATAISVAAIFYAMHGAAGLLQQLYGGHRWAAELTLGGVSLGAVFVTGRFAVRRLLAMIEHDVRERYEIRQAEAADRARESERDADAQST